MKRKYLIKKAAKNIFSGKTGIFAIQLTGTSDCIVTEHATKALKNPSNITNRKIVPIKKYAYHIYNNVALEQIEKITSSCGVDQCVHPDHLVAQLSKEKSCGDY